MVSKPGRSSKIRNQTFFRVPTILKQDNPFIYYGQLFDTLAVFFHESFPEKFSRKNLWLCDQRPVFNNMRLPLGVYLAPRGEFCVLGGMFTPSVTHRASLLLTKMEGRTEGLHPRPQGITSPLGDKIHP
jgi:hypothetical protein